MPAGVIEEFLGIVGTLIHWVLAAHLDVTAQRNGIDPVVRITPAEPDEPFPEADGELLHPYPEPLRYGVVAELVDQNHEAQDGNYGDE